MAISGGRVTAHSRYTRRVRTTPVCLMLFSLRCLEVLTRSVDSAIPALPEHLASIHAEGETRRLDGGIRRLARPCRVDLLLHYGRPAPRIRCFHRPLDRFRLACGRTCRSAPCAHHSRDGYARPSRNAIRPWCRYLLWRDPSRVGLQQCRTIHREEGARCRRSEHSCGRLRGPLLYRSTRGDDAPACIGVRSQRGVCPRALRACVSGRRAA